MPPLKPQRFKVLIKKLRKHDSRFEVYDKRGKGSHRVIYHPNILGRSKSFPIKCHGDNPEISKYVISDIIRRFGLPDDLF